MQTPFLTVCISPPGGTQQIFILGGSALTPNPYPFIYHFSRKRYSFRILELMSCVWPVNTLFPTIVSGLLCNWWCISVPGTLRSTSYESTHPTLKKLAPRKLTVWTEATRSFGSKIFVSFAITNSSTAPRCKIFYLTCLIWQLVPSHCTAMRNERLRKFVLRSSSWRS